MQIPSSIQNKKAVSLVELVVAMTLFIILSTTGLVLISQVSKAAKKTEMKEYLATEAQALLTTLSKTIQASALDYEEYYSRNVIQATPVNFGTNYGEYHKQFFHPGSDNNYGAECTNGSPFIPGTSSCTPDISTFDYETGAHPYTGNGNPEDANAFCENCPLNLEDHQTNELFLIDKAGSLKTMFILNAADGRLETLRLEGSDTTGNGINDTWDCTPDFTSNCTGPPATATDFLPISPENLFIDNIWFYLSPIEDPFKGYNDIGTTFQSVQQQPRVTIVLEAHYQLFDGSGAPISISSAKDYIGDAPTITLQTTIGTAVNSEISAYSSP